MHGSKVDMDDQLAAKVAQRGRVLERCDVLDKEWDSILSAVPAVQVAYIGRGPVHMERRCVGGRERHWHWACTCGACAECLGPEAFGGVGDACL